MTLASRYCRCFATQFAQLKLHTLTLPDKLQSWYGLVWRVCRAEGDMDFDYRLWVSNLASLKITLRDSDAEALWPTPTQQHEP